MSHFDPSMNSEFLEYADLQLRRHAVLKQGLEGEPNLDVIEDRMTQLWDALDEVQRKSANGMASDLNWIRRNGQPAPKSRRSEDVTTQDQQELAAASEKKEWHRCLHDLRLCASVIPVEKLAYHRGSKYDAIGLPDYAAAFYEFAAERSPSNPAIGVIALRSMDRVDPGAALRRAGQLIRSHRQSPPAVVALSADMMLRRDEAEGRLIDRDFYHSILDEARDRLSLELPSEAGGVIFYQLAASAYKILDELAVALQCYEAGLRLDPDNEPMLIGLGLLLYGSQTERAVQSFQHVVRGREVRSSGPTSSCLTIICVMGTTPNHFGWGSSLENAPRPIQSRPNSCNGKRSASARVDIPPRSFGPSLPGLSDSIPTMIGSVETQWPLSSR